MRRGKRLIWLCAKWLLLQICSRESVSELRPRMGSTNTLQEETGSTELRGIG